MNLSPERRAEIADDFHAEMTSDHPTFSIAAVVERTGVSETVIRRIAKTGKPGSNSTSMALMQFLAELDGDADPEIVVEFPESMSDDDIEALFFGAFERAAKKHLAYQDAVIVAAVEKYRADFERVASSQTLSAAAKQIKSIIAADDPGEALVAPFARLALGVSPEAAKPKGSKPTAKPKSERRAKALAAKAAIGDSKPARSKLTDEEWIDRLAQALRDDPTTTASTEFLYAKFVDLIASSRSRIVPAFAAAVEIVKAEGVAVAV